MNQESPADTPRPDAPARPEHAPLLWALLGAAEAQRERLEEALKAVGLSRAKMEVLHQLVQAGEPLPLRVLAEGQHCVPSNMTTLVDRLEAEGLVQRVAAPDDRRSVRAALTPLGRERAAASMRVFAEVKAAFDAAVPPGERAALTRLLTALSAT